MADTVRRLRIVTDVSGNADSKLSALTGTLGTVGKLAGGLALGGLAAIGGGMAAVGASGLSMNNSMEQARARINAFTKDGAKTADILDMVQERAAKTPFAFQDMAAAAGGLIPVANQAGESLESLIQDAEILAASNPAEGLEGAAFALREAVSGDFTSIIERFNLPRQYINELKEQGVPALEIVRQAMKKMGYDTDLVSSLAETAEGRWSTFKDTLQGIAAQLTQPIFDRMSSGLGIVNGLLERNMPMLENMAVLIGERIATSLDNFSLAAQNMYAQVQPVIDSIITAFQNGGWTGVIQLVADTLSEAWTTQVMPVVNQWVTDATSWVVTTYTRIPELLTNLFTRIREFLTNEGTLSIRESVQGWVATFWEWVQGAIADVGTTLAAILAAIGAWAASSEAQKELNATGEAIGEWIFDGLKFLLENQQKIAEIMIRLATGLLMAIGAITGILISVGGQIVAGIISGILKKIGIDLKPTTLNELGSVLKGIGTNLYTIAKHQIGTTISKGIASGISSTAGIIARAAMQAAKEAFDRAKNFLRVGSPSKKFAELGVASMQGFAAGMVQQQNKTGGVVQNAMSSLVQAPSVGGLAAGAGGVTVQLNYSPVVSTADAFELERVLTDVVRRINRKP